MVYQLTSSNDISTSSYDIYQLTETSVGNRLTWAADTTSAAAVYGGTPNTIKS